MRIISLLIIILNYSRGDPNIVFIVTDDQDLLLDGMVPMKNSIKLIANNGKTFENAFANTPVCCPSRSTILTGKYAHNTGVVNNSINGNCSSPFWQKYHEPQSIAAILKNKKDYVTFYAGKYLNQYGDKKAGGLEHVPEGYDWWIGLQGNSRYYNYTLSINGTANFSEDSYLTDILAQHSLNFLNQRPHEKPFFMMIATPAPHAPFTPADRHKNRYKGVRALRTPSFNHSSLDKHWLVRMPPEYLPEDVTILDDIQEHRLESLLAVDELVEQLVQKLKSLNLLENTYVILTSDNGFHIGQFGQPWDKRQPYETDIRVPFIISGPKIPKKSLDSFPISAVDFAPTILDLVDIPIPEYMDGKSFKKKLFSENSQSFKEAVFIEYWGEGNNKEIDDRCPWKYDQNLTECALDQWCKCQDARNNTYTCIVDFSENQVFKFCEFYDSQNFIEAYNLTVDPYELENIGASISSTDTKIYMKSLTDFKNCQGEECNRVRFIQK